MRRPCAAHLDATTGEHVVEGQDGRVSRLRHGYTNRTRRLAGGVVEKHYDGTDAAERAEREYICLTHLADQLPVPQALDRDPARPALMLREVPGAHGQDLIEAGRATEVLRLLGALLARLQAVDVSVVPGLPGRGEVIVHGDFGPQNLLVDRGHVSALLDWEFAHLGRPVEDLAWAEWIVRMHHPDHREELPELFEAARLEPGWMDRQVAMVDRCTDLLRRAEYAGRADSAKLWRTRLLLTEAWME
jgi:tRNA A-37 threonylcarbamoyl transferase component Bud32